MPGLLEPIVAISVLALVLAMTADEDAPAPDEDALASVGWL